MQGSHKGKMGLAEKVFKGDIKAASRLMRDIDDEMESAIDELKALYAQTGKAATIGITGPPGVGKSTLVDKMVEVLRGDKKTVGVILVDPTSPLTGGAILGDRIRMKHHFTTGNVFIRSMANRGVLGGLARATEDVIKILDVYGCDIIIVETVGVGQSEVEIFKSAQTVAVLLVPGMGDDIQAIKAGIMEITDIFVVNKMDLEGADRKVAEITQMLELHSTFKYDSQESDDKYSKLRKWTPEIVKVNSKSGENFDIFLELLDHHQKFINETGIIENYVKSRIKNETIQILKYKLTKRVQRLLSSNSDIEEYIRLVMDKSLDPYSMANLIIKLLGIE